MYETIETLWTFKNAVILGGISVGVVAAIWILSWIAQWGWYWVDDGQTEPKDLFGKVIKKFSSNSRWTQACDICTNSDMSFNWYKDAVVYKDHTSSQNDYMQKGRRRERLSDGKYIVFSDASSNGIHITIHMVIWLLAFLLPITIWIGLTFWQISLFALAFVTIAFTARMARRQQKLFKAHTEDKEAHK